MSSQFFDSNNYLRWGLTHPVKLNRTNYNSSSINDSLEQVYQFYRSGYQLDYSNYANRYSRANNTYNDYWGDGKSFTITDAEWNYEKKKNLKKEDFL